MLVFETIIVVRHLQPCLLLTSPDTGWSTKRVVDILLLKHNSDDFKKPRKTKNPRDAKVSWLARLDRRYLLFYDKLVIVVTAKKVDFIVVTQETLHMCGMIKG
ncbi:hypothetical protein R1flu_003651 [Riccia fluitans]|uniref:Uncharacterized protein n=1 Tax=Riccia fluitans TaxID=41844 RepID=A0ABD1Y9Y9_9MARC